MATQTRLPTSHLGYVRRKIDYWRALEAGKDVVARRIADELASQTHTKT